MIQRLKQQSPKIAYQLKITLLESDPIIWRRLIVSGNVKLNRLHEAIQTVMGWSDSHLHQFVANEKNYAPNDPDNFDGNDNLNEAKYTLCQIAPTVNSLFLYEYDFGDYWQHEILVEAITPSETTRVKAVCMAGENACPPEDCGGMTGYEELKKILRNKKHPDYQHMAEWAGPRFNPSHFSLDSTNILLSGLRL